MTILTRGIYTMLQVHLRVTNLIEAYLISTIYHQHILYVVLQHTTRNYEITPKQELL